MKSFRKPRGISNIGDPFILFFNGTYYMYATSFIDGFNVWTSLDLITWSEPSIAYQMGARSFGNADYWAPEVVYHHGQFIMHYSSRHKEHGSLRIGVAISDHPLGPFIDVYDQQPMFDLGYAVIDGHVLKDDDQYYLYYSRDCSEYIFEGRHESHIYVVTLDETLTKITSEPTLITYPQQSWETITGDWRWNEGPFVIKVDDLYYLMFSSGFYASQTYALGYATSRSPLGPFVKAQENPILKTTLPILSGPGHNAVFYSHDHQLLTAYHGHTYIDQPSSNRQLFIDRLIIDDKKLKIIELPFQEEANAYTLKTSHEKL
jgi:beta-xylosidase